MPGVRRKDPGPSNQTCYLYDFVDEQYSLLPYDLLQARTDDALPYHADLASLGNDSDPRLHAVANGIPRPGNPG